MSRITIRTLGALSILVDGVVVDDLPKSPLLQALLGYLIVHREEWVERSKLAGLLWPEVPEGKALHSLSSHLWRLNKAIAQGRLFAAMTSTRYALRWQVPADGWLDLDEWDGAMVALSLDSKASYPVTHNALDAMANVAALYCGPLLDGLDTPWCDRVRYRYEAQLIMLLRHLTHSCTALEEVEQAIHWANQWLALEPYDEAAHAALIRLHQRSGQPQAALTAYEHYVSTWEELGLPPTPALHDLMMAGVKPPSVSPSDPALSMALTRWLSSLLPSPMEAEGERGALVRAGIISSLSHAAIEIGALQEDAFAWEAAQQSYEVALSLLSPPVNNEDRQHHLALRLRVDRLYDRLAQRQPQRANLQAALDLAQRLEDGALQSEVWARLCWLEQRTSQLAASLEAAAKALSLAKEGTALRAQALRLLGVSHDLMGQFDLAVRMQWQALTETERCRGEPRLARINLSSSLLSVNQPWQAIAQAQAALGGAQAAPPMLFDLLALGNLGTALGYVGAFNEAESSMQRARAIAAMLGSRPHEAWILCRTATLFRWMGLKQEARFWVQQSWIHAQGMEEGRVLLEAALEQAHIAAWRSDASAARTWCETAHRLADRFKVPRYNGRLMLLLAYIEFQAGNTQSAQAHATTAHTQIERSGETRLQLPLIALLGHLLREDDPALIALYQQAQDEQYAARREAPTPQARATFLQAMSLRQWIRADQSPAPAPISWVW